MSGLWERHEGQEAFRGDNFGLDTPFGGWREQVDIFRDPKYSAQPVECQWWCEADVQCHGFVYCICAARSNAWKGSESHL